MEINTLLIAKEKLITSFNFEKLISINDVEHLYYVMQQIIESNQTIQQYMAEKYNEYEQAVRYSKKYADIFISYLNLLSQLYNKKVDKSLYNLELYEYIIGNFNCMQFSDKNYFKYETLLDYIMDLLQDISNSYKKEDFENISQNFQKYNDNLANVNPDEFINTNIKYNNNFNKIKSSFIGSYEFYAYYINKVNLNKINGASISLFVLPLKYVTKDLLSFLNQTINQDEGLKSNKIEKFLNQYKLNETETNVFRARCQNLNSTNKYIAKQLNLSEASVEAAINNIMPHLREELSIPSEHRYQFKKLIQMFIK